VSRVHRERCDHREHPLAKDVVHVAAVLVVEVVVVIERDSGCCESGRHVLSEGPMSPRILTCGLVADHLELFGRPETVGRVAVCPERL